jgi:hypothetical protein
MCSCGALEALPTVKAPNDVPGEPPVTEENPSLPAAIAGTMSALMTASTA